MSTETLERLPNTVTACHKLIRALKDSEGDGEVIKALRREVEDKDAEIEELGKTISAHEERIDELEKEVEERADPIAAIDNFLFEVQRPVGQFKFDVLHGPATDRAIVGLYDAVGRQP